MSGDSVWWSQRWLDCVLEARELRIKARKGRVFARRGRVKGIEVHSGLVTAQVHTDDGGSVVHRVEIFRPRLRIDRVRTATRKDSHISVGR